MWAVAGRRLTPSLVRVCDSRSGRALQLQRDHRSVGPGLFSRFAVETPVFLGQVVEPSTTHMNFFESNTGIVTCISPACASNKDKLVTLSSGDFNIACFV